MIIDVERLMVYASSYGDDTTILTCR